MDEFKHCLSRRHFEMKNAIKHDRKSAQHHLGQACFAASNLTLGIDW